MLKMMIADDEPKIRRGMAEAIDWAAHGVEVAAFAGNGREALEKTQAAHFDLCLVDIYMPFVNGLEFIEKLKQNAPEMLCIVVTGYDEFDYAQTALRLGVFDYLLKPINEKALSATIKRAVASIDSQCLQQKQLTFAKQMLQKNKPILQEQFINQLLEGVLTQEEIGEQLDFHEIPRSPYIGLATVAISEHNFIHAQAGEWDRQLLRFAVRNIFVELVETATGQPALCSADAYENIVVLVSLAQPAGFARVKQTALAQIEQLTGQTVRIFAQVVANYEQISAAYSNWLASLEGSGSPYVAGALRCIDKNYTNPSFHFKQVAQELNISPSYLSRLFKNEIGLTFVDYLTRVRIQEAVTLLNNRDLRIYEISDQIGYSSQHYFCAAFKRVLGLSPTQYRQRKSK